MKQDFIQIGHIPAVLWGEPSSRLILAVHGGMSHKADTVIELLARHAADKGSQVLSFDLPGHGDRREEPTPCKALVCVEELRMVMAYAQAQAEDIRLFGCSLGAYFSLLAFAREPLGQALFLSPVTDMRRLTENMMTWFSVSEARLEAEGEIPTPSGQTLYWDDYCYLKEHPVSAWAAPTKILYGSADNLCEREVVSGFAERFGCEMTVLEQGEHFFHTLEQLAFYEKWLEVSL